jgi:hypothetical protein
MYAEQLIGIHQENHGLVTVFVYIWIIDRLKGQKDMKTLFQNKSSFQGAPA